MVHTKAYNDTDPYGKPAQVFEHEGGISGIATDLKQMLAGDLSNRLNLELYNNHVVEAKREQKQQSQQPEQRILFGSVPPIEQKEQIQQTKEKAKKVKYQALEVSVSEPVMSLYDLFGFSQEERTQVKPSRGKKRTPPKDKPVQLSLFSSDKSSSVTNDKANNRTYPIADARKDEQQAMLREEERKQSFELRPFSGELSEYHKEGSLVEDGGQIGYLKNRYKDESNFQPLDLHFAQRAKIGRYIEIRDFYHTLYNHEANHLTEHASLRSNLNLVYDNFVRRYGNLNDKKNLDVIKMDAGGK